MKRFVVIVTSLLIIFVFIALNYLLWDRESLVTIKESNQASIDALSRINMTLGEDKSRLEQKIEELGIQLKEKEDRIEALENDISSQEIFIEDKTQFIIDLKTQLNTEPLRQTTVEWINSIAERSYSEAYIKSGSSCRFWGNIWSLRSFSDFFDTSVEQILLSLTEEEEGEGDEEEKKGEEEPQPMIEVLPSETPDWEMIVLAEVDITLKEGAEQEYLINGENLLRLTYLYNERLEQWQITSITGVHPENSEGMTEETDQIEEKDDSN